jgi:hypothetical protein
MLACWSTVRAASQTLPEFDVSVATTRSGTWTVRVDASTPTQALQTIEAECAAGQCHCPPEFCTDDLYSTVVGVRQVTPRAPAIAEQRTHA